MEGVGLIPPLLGAPVVAACGTPAGTVADLLVDGVSGRPAWALLHRPAPAGPVLVPAPALRSRCRAVELPWDAAHVARAPAAGDWRDAPSPAQAAALCRHYGVSPWDVPPVARLSRLRGERRAVATAAAAVAA
ncbi:MAG TPA: hypothetical protein VLB47_03900 [Solirubrobacteraceae bacterium]|nr:hypothetical protein [Solirubrobacteraceae bacterium]